MSKKLDIKKELKLSELYEQIYDNALEDRDRAGVLFEDLCNTMTDPANHAANGMVIAKYLERLNKSNDQLIKILDIKQQVEITKEKNKDNIHLSDEEKDELFDQIAQQEVSDESK